MKRVGMIGLGEMGLPMAKNLVRRGFEAVGFDLRGDPCRALAQAGGHAATTAAEAARLADAVVVMVRTPAQAEQVVLGEDGVLAQAKPGATVIVMSTIGVGPMRRLGTAAREREFPFLDAPVSGGRARAEDGTLTIIVGAAPKDLAPALPVLEAMGSQIEHVGDVGAGTAVKMANQVLLTVSFLAAREVAAMAETTGVPIERLWEVLKTCTGTTWVVEHWSTARTWIESDQTGKATLDILVKDTGLALDFARDSGVPARLLPLAAQMIQELTRQIGG
ncbi:MAG TPA: NAD(P)-dependent oxidoreductase [bacterium]|nr:NAD(P)-dependent oxidoreductase [bacterium]